MSVALNKQGKDQGAPLVLLHGWGMNAGIWGEFADILASKFQIIFIELPGHGHNTRNSALALDAFAATLKDKIKQPAHWLGWSLGGSFLIRLASMAPERIKTLTLVATSPCFVQQENWLPAMKEVVLNQFAESLQKDSKKTLLRFIALQAMSAEAASHTLALLRKNIAESPLPDSQALNEGLSILRDADLRESFEALSVPIQVVLGQHDKLVPQEISEYFCQHVAVTQLDIISGAGHAPFISHPQQTAELVNQFIQAQQL